MDEQKENVEAPEKKEEVKFSVPAHNTRKTTLPTIASASATNYVCKWRICD